MDTDNPIAKFFIPQYSGLALYLMSLAFVLLFFTQPELRSESFGLLFPDKIDFFDPGNYLVLAFFISGLIFSTYHVFTIRQKTDFEKAVMLIFAVMVNGFSGIAAGIHMLRESQGFLILFPIWNIFNGALLLLIFRLDIIDVSNIKDDNSTISQVLLGTLFVVATFVVCNFVYEMYWAVTFSICVAYASNLNSAFQSIFASPQESITNR